MTTLSEKDLTDRLAEISQQVDESPCDRVAIMVERDTDYARIIAGLKKTFGEDSIEECGSPAFFPSCNRVLVYK